MEKAATWDTPPNTLKILLQRVTWHLTCSHFHAYLFRSCVEPLVWYPYCITGVAPVSLHSPLLMALSWPTKIPLLKSKEPNKIYLTLRTVKIQGHLTLRSLILGQLIVEHQILGHLILRELIFTPLILAQKFSFI